MAQAIVDDFVDSTVPLEDSLVKVARDMELNAHEARRLLEATNVNAHLSLMQKMGEDHRYVEFATLDPTKVAALLFDGGEKTAEYYEPEASSDPGFEYLALELPDERYEDIRHRVEKVAAEAVPVIEYPGSGKYEGERGWAAAATLHKTGEELEMQLRVSHLDYEDKVASLLTFMKRVDTIGWDELEKDAMSLFEESAFPVIRKLRSTFTPGAWQTPLEKQAHFVVCGEEHSLFEECVLAHKECVKLAKALTWFEQRTS
jgi:hypothetical protein